jgi:hypothetical protein
MTPPDAREEREMNTAICDCGDTGKRDCPRCGWLWDDQNGPTKPQPPQPVVGIDTEWPR